MHSAVHSSSLAPLGLLPLSGVLPDMKASSTQYVSLQNAFRTKAKVDLERFGKILQDVLQEVGGRAIGQEEVESFVKHGKFLLVVRGRSLRMEQESSLLKGRIGALPFSILLGDMLIIASRDAGGGVVFRGAGRESGHLPRLPRC